VNHDVARGLAVHEANSNVCGEVFHWQMQRPERP
jgi:hypothetical protein